MNLKKKVPESPEQVRMSLAAAMTLGFKKGIFYRNAELHCINLLLTYASGCSARCAYCGLSNRRPGEYGDKSFIRVTWPTYLVAEITERIAGRMDRVKRICISMITNKRAVADTRNLCERLRNAVDIPVSILVSPTILSREDLLSFKTAGADKVGVAIDLASPELFDQYRGAGVSGPHQWETYWQCLADAINIFGKGNAGPHFMVGMGETEKQICAAIQRARNMGARTHLFSFFPEAGSVLSELSPPPMDTYRRIQLARYLIDNRLFEENRFEYDQLDRINDFGIPHSRLSQIVDSGEPFRTNGCTGYDGQVACNRPYANSRPGPNIRNYPFPPTSKDVLRIRKQLRFEEISVELHKGKEKAPSYRDTQSL
jgi:biotin synthase-related radical SAM superfamily protein